MLATVHMWAQAAAAAVLFSCLHCRSADLSITFQYLKIYALTWLRLPAGLFISSFVCLCAARQLPGIGGAGIDECCSWPLARWCLKGSKPPYCLLPTRVGTLNGANWRLINRSVPLLKNPTVKTTACKWLALFTLESGDFSCQTSCLLNI